MLIRIFSFLRGFRATRTLNRISIFCATAMWNGKTSWTLSRVSWIFTNSVGWTTSIGISGHASTMLPMIMRNWRKECSFN